MVDFQSHIEEYNNRKINVIGASTDNLEDASETVKKHDLTFTIAFNLNAKRVSAVTGAFFDKGKGYIHATGFIIQPESIVHDAVYSTGSIGRFTAPDCLGMIDFLSRDKSNT